MSVIITDFRGPYSFLSNFYREPDGTFVEKEYQAAKCADSRDLLQFAFGMTPAQAKAAGQRVRLRPDWEQVKLPIMRKLVLCKFTEHPWLRRKLLDTGDAYLEEGNTWRDTYWGVYEGIGQNHLGKILMWVRKEIW